MSSLLSILLHELHQYGYPVLWLIIFMAAVGLPLPASLVLLAAGAFAAHGYFNIAMLVVITIIPSSCGRNQANLIGIRWGGKQLPFHVDPIRHQYTYTHPLTPSYPSYQHKQQL